MNQMSTERMANCGMLNSKDRLQAVIDKVMGMLNRRNKDEVGKREISSEKSDISGRSDQVKK